MSDEKPNTPRDDLLHDRFVRWQQITVQQLTYAINLILGFSAATLGFEISLSVSDKLMLPCWGAALYMLSLLALGASMIFGMSAVLSRLHDFRYTAKIARLESESPRKGGKIERLRGVTDVLGRMSWCSFYAQVGTFVLGVILGAIVLFPLAASRAA